MTLGATSTHQKKSTHVGTIVGGVIGGLGALMIWGLALLLYRRRLAARRPLKPTPFGAGHNSLWDKFQMTTNTNFGYQGIGFATRNPTTRAERDFHSYSVAHPDVLRLHSLSPPPPGRTVVNTRDRNWEDIAPFVVPSDQRGFSRSQGNRKHAQGVINPVYNLPNSTPLSIIHEADASTSNHDHPSSRPANPPAYTAYPGPAGVMPPARTRLISTKTGPAVPSFSADPTSGRYPTTAVPGASSVLGLGDPVEQVRLGRPETMSGTGVHWRLG